jgi:hypothetical protein
MYPSSTSISLYLHPVLIHCSSIFGVSEWPICASLFWNIFRPKRLPRLWDPAAKSAQISCLDALRHGSDQSMNVLKHIESLSLWDDFDLSVYKSSRYIMIYTYIYIIKISIINMCIYVLFQHLYNWMVDARTSSWTSTCAHMHMIAYAYECWMILQVPNVFTH